MLSHLGRPRIALGLALFCALAAEARPADPLPPAPRHYFNDYAGVVSRDTALRLDQKLQAFATETSTQIVVAVMPSLPEGEALEDFTNRTAQAWRVGQQKQDNGAVLFVFKNDRKLRIEVGYGLEGALTDALSKRIIDEAIVPQFRAGHWDQGLEAGVDAMIAATRGEYTAPPKASGGRGIPPIVIIVVILIIFAILNSRGGGMRGPIARNYSRRGSTPWIFTSGSGWGGGSWGGGGGGGGGGGFSGGGGSFGGGGASGSW